MSAFTLRGTGIVALQQIALAAVLFVLLSGWLQIPDANAFEVAASVLTALLMAAVAGAGESAIALRLTGRRVTGRRLLVGLCAVLVAVLVWLAISTVMDRLEARTPLWAGYLNSRFPASMRNAFSYRHLVAWLGWLCSGIRCIAAGLLAAIAFAVIACDAPARGVAALYRSARYWLAVLLLAGCFAVVTGALLAWTPGHGLVAEATSLVFRIVCVVLVDALAAAWLLQSMATVVLRPQSAGTAEPVASQLRTDGIP